MTARSRQMAGLSQDALDVLLGYLAGEADEDIWAQGLQIAQQLTDDLNGVGGSDGTRPEGTRVPARWVRLAAEGMHLMFCGNPGCPLDDAYEERAESALAPVIADLDRLVRQWWADANAAAGVAAQPEINRAIYAAQAGAYQQVLDLLATGDTDE